MERSEGLNWWYISLSKAIRDKDQREREMLIGRHGKGRNAMGKQRLNMLMSQTSGRRNLRMGHVGPVGRGSVPFNAESPDLDTAAAMTDNAESCCLAVASRQCRRWASCLSVSGDRVGVLSWMHRRMSQSQRETNAAVSIWAVTANGKPGRESQPSWPLQLDPNVTHPAEGVAGTRRGKGPT